MHPDYARLKAGDKETTARYLNRGVSIESGFPVSHYFSPLMPNDCVHILVKVTLNQSALKKQKKSSVPLTVTPKIIPSVVADFWSSYRLKSVGVIPWAEFDQDKLSDKIGETVETPCLHAFWEGFGGFPASYFVRKEETKVWQLIKAILVEGIDKAVLVGSPGVGKSTLLAVATFYVAFILRKNVLVVRRLRIPGADNALVYLTPDGGTNSTVNVSGLSFFVRSRPPNTMVFVDGLTQQEANDGELNAHEFFATSCQFDIKSDDSARIVLLPAWKTDDLLLYAKNSNWVVNVGLRETRNLKEATWPKLVRDHHFYSGGSLREFCRRASAIMMRVRRLCQTLRNEEAVELVYDGVGVSSSSQRDRLRCQYVMAIDDPASYEDDEKWYSLVDSGYALRRLGLRGSLSSQVELYKQAELIGGGFQGIAFEQVVHRFISSLMQKAWDWDLLPKPASINLRPCVTNVVCTGSKEEGCIDAIKNLPWGTYWYPEYPSFPFIDAIMPCKMFRAGSKDGEDVVVYVQVTISGERRRRTCASLTWRQRLQPTRACVTRSGCFWSSHIVRSRLMRSRCVSCLHKTSASCS